MGVEEGNRTAFFANGIGWIYLGNFCKFSVAALETINILLVI